MFNTKIDNKHIFRYEIETFTNFSIRSKRNDKVVANHQTGLQHLYQQSVTERSSRDRQAPAPRERAGEAETPTTATQKIQRSQRRLRTFPSTEASRRKRRVTVFIAVNGSRDPSAILHESIRRWKRFAEAVLETRVHQSDASFGDPRETSLSISEKELPLSDSIQSFLETVW